MPTTLFLNIEKNDDKYYNFAFQEQDAFDSVTLDRSISFVQGVLTKNDTSRTILNQYDLFKNISDENERTTGFDLKFNFRVNDYISGQIKVGSKAKNKDKNL